MIVFKESGRRRAVGVVFMVVILSLMAAAAFEFQSLGMTAGCAGFAVLVIWEIARPRYCLTIDHEGIIDYASRLRAGRIRWEEITRVTITIPLNSRCVGIDVADRRALYARARAFRFLAMIQSGWMGCPVNIFGNELSGTSTTELFEMTRRYWRDPEARKSLGGA